MTVQRQTDLNALIASRICHDLISPLGAIGNGVELMSLTDAGRGPEMTLIGEGITSANARLRFFRLAFGSAGHDQKVGQAEVMSVLADLDAGGRIRHVWQPKGDSSRTDVKIVFLSLLCLETALAYGGTVTADLGPEVWTVSAAARRMKLDETLWHRLMTAMQTGTDPVQDVRLSPAHVQFALLPQEIARQGRAFAVDIGADRIAIRFGAEAGSR